VDLSRLENVAELLKDVWAKTQDTYNFYKANIRAVVYPLGIGITLLAQRR